MGAHGEGRRLPALVALGSFGQLKLHPIDAIDAVDEEYQDENERYLQPVLNFGDDWVFRQESVIQPALALRDYLA